MSERDEVTARVVLVKTAAKVARPDATIRPRSHLISASLVVNENRVQDHALQILVFSVPAIAFRYSVAKISPLY